MSDPNPTGSRTLCIIRAHEVAAQMKYSPTSCYAVLTCLTEGVINSNRLSEGVRISLNSASTALKALQEQDVFHAEKVKNGKTVRVNFHLTSTGKRLAARLLS